MLNMGTEIKEDMLGDPSIFKQLVTDRVVKARGIYDAFSSLKHNYVKLLFDGNYLPLLLKGGYPFHLLGWILRPEPFSLLFGNPQMISKERSKERQ